MTEEKLRTVVTIGEKNELRKVITIDEEKKKSHEEKEYLLMLSYFVDDDSERVTEFKILIGRTVSREYIIDNVYDMDIHKSYVLVEGLKLEDRISVYSFMTHLAEYYNSDSFDIEDHNYSDVEEDELEEQKRSSEDIIDYNVVEHNINYNFPLDDKTTEEDDETL